jgi:nucleotide-binding universal stress UspA family protein
MGYSRKHETAFQARTSWMERIQRDEYRVMVALDDRASLPSLMETALAIARTHKGEVVAVTVVEVPDGEPITAGLNLPPRVEARLEEAVRYGRERGMEVRPVVEVGRRASHALVQAASEAGCNFLVMGQPRMSSFLERLLPTAVDRVLENAPCQIAVVYGRIRPGTVKQVIVPVTRDANATLAARLAPAFAEWFDVGIRAVTVVDHSLSDQEAAHRAADAQTVLEGADLDSELEVVHRRDPAIGLLRTIGEGEVVVMGAPSSGPLVPLVGQTIPALIAGRHRNPVIVVRAVEEQRTRRMEDAFFSRKQAP